MFCENCGNQLDDNDLFCTKCGHRVAEITAPKQEAEPVKESVAVVEVSDPQAEEPKVEVAEVEEPKVEVAQAEEPTVEVPQVEEPKVEVAKVEEPKVEVAQVEVPQVEEPKVEVAKVEEPKVEVAQVEAPQVEAPKAEAPQTEAPQTEPKAEEKAPKKFPIVPMAIIGALAVIILLVAANFTKLTNFVVRTVSSPEKYYQHVEQKEMKEAASILADIYQNAFLSNAKLNDISSDVELSVELGEDAQEMLADAMYVDDADWLSKMSMSAGASIKDLVVSGEASFTLGKDKLVSGAAVIDFDKAEAYLQVPELTSQYLGVSLEEVLGYSYMDADELADIFKSYEELYKAYPDKKTVEKLANRYMGIIIKNIDSVRKSSDTLEVGDIEQKCTVLRVRLTQKSIYRIMEAVCEEALEDKELLEVITTFAAAAGGEDMDADDVEEAFLEGIENYLEYIDRMKERASDSEMVMNVWVNSKGEVVGRDITMNDNEKFVYYMPQKGKKYELELAYTDGWNQMELTGIGKKSSTSLDGEFELAISGVDIVDITVDNYNIKKAKQGFVNGKFTVKPSKALLKEMDLGMYSSIISKYAVTIDMSGSKNNVKYDVALVDDDEIFGKVVLSAKTGAGKKSSVSKSKVTMVEDEEDLVEWVEEIDFEKLIKKLDKTDIPVEWIEDLEDACDDLEDMLSYY